MWESPESRRFEPPIRVSSRGFTGLYRWLLLKGGMWLLRRGSAHWKNKSVYIVDGLQVVVRFTLADPDAPNTIMVSPSIWLSLGTSGARGKRPSVGSGHVSEGSGILPIRSISEFTGKSPVAVSQLDVE